MKTFKFQRDWSGYSRGQDTVEVEACSLEEAQEKLDGIYWDFDRDVVRDDINTENWELAD